MEDGQDESEVLHGLFEEIMKMLRHGQAKIESIVHQSIERGSLSEGSFRRLHKMLEDYGRKNKWLPES